MFIPLNSVKENGWPNVLAIGDTASVFFLLSLLAPYKLNVFIADTGVDSAMPLHFRRGEKSAPDVAAAYYDFFDSPYRIGAGALRRMNLIVYTVGRGYISGWARRFRVPAAFMKRRPDGAIFEIEGALPDAGSLVGSRTVEGAISAVLLGLADTAASGRYAASSSIVTIDADGSGRVYPPAERKLPGKIVPEETAYSAWDGIVEVLQPGESAVIDIPDSSGPVRISASPTAGPKLIELGVPELHVLRIEGPNGRCIELTGDAQRVFDGVL
ncbi:MAG TPA: hypothetical protein VGJ92_01785 [Methanocella sp.]|jgi:hypothetical protein